MRELTVIIPTHNPDRGRLGRTLDSLRAQSIDPGRWETLLVDNASKRFPEASFLEAHSPGNLRTVGEPALGLTSARRRGFIEASAPVAILVDDDNVLAPDYLAQSLALAASHPAVGVLGGRVLPEFAAEPPAWAREFFGLLALRDLGDQPMVSNGLRPPGSERNVYPDFAPMGAGMVLRREVWEDWLKSLGGPGPVPSDRRGADLTSGGDNDIVFAALKGGWDAAYFPQLSLRHLIPAARFDPEYLGRLNRAMQRSWVNVLGRHGACPWRSVPAWSVPLRQARAWIRSRAWSGTAERIRWEGLAGRLAGQGDLASLDRGP